MSTASEQEIASCCFSVAAAVVDELEVCPRYRLSLYLSHSSLTNSNLDFQMSCFGASQSPKEQFLQCCLVFNYLSPCSSTNVQAVARASRKGAGKAGLRDCLADGPWSNEAHLGGKMTRCPGAQEMKPAPSASAVGTWLATLVFGRLFVTVPRTSAQHDSVISKELIQPLPREAKEKACRAGSEEDMEGGLCKRRQGAGPLFAL